MCGVDMTPTIDATDELTDAAMFETLALVDTALTMVAQREVFTRDEGAGRCCVTPTSRARPMGGGSHAAVS